MPPDFPALHIRPRSGWLNDPNGLCRVDGTYHAFFQYNPYGPMHDRIHWGHVSSHDLLSWRAQPLALTPRPGGADAAGCWTGCVVEDSGVPTAVYTGVPDHAGHAAVLVSRSDRTLQRWSDPGPPVAAAPRLPGVEEVRDPFVFGFEGRRYAVQGAGARFGSPSLLLWECDDLRDWHFLGPLLTADDPVATAVAPANVWECPNLVLLDQQWVLLLSRWRWVDDAYQHAGVRYLLGDLIRSGCGLRFVAESGGIVDEGSAFYAPQLLSEPTRSLLWGWSSEIGRTQAQVRAAGWAGVLTFPRELFLDGDRLCSRPAAELRGLRKTELGHRSGAPLSVRRFELCCTAAARLRLLDGSAELFALEVDGAPAAPSTTLVDASMVERFRGGRTRTERAYPTVTSRWVLDAEPASCRIWALGEPAPGPSDPIALS